ncbi:MAG: 3D domain-containing protein [Kiritimatiellae bacterium]|nr:3D domain-containing protein [Kiritimatiellia bacterium]
MKTTYFSLTGLTLTLLFLVFLFSGCSTIKPPKGVNAQTYTIETTGYCSCGKCCGWKRNWMFRPVYSSGPNKGKRKEVGITASGTKARRGILAADTSIFPFGTIMEIPGFGYGIVEDRGGAIKGYKVDIFFPKHKEALNWGRQSLKVKVWKPKK